ncbi:MAG: tRNA uridine-5-carboxymethylaminomethyl(34) synthesis enzyme MnmG [candidate division Zixibacteria bacterium]|nr:tRNA uridine-5-carboxymethylaminomethyl(34) synthesis enzyme MnmG [Candidatus Tariuqbacter arcticus]
MNDYEIIVIGGGHAGCEAASAAARMGAKTALLTLRRDALGRMSCNPAVGGMAKGQLVKEVDAIGGEIGYIADKAAVQFRALGRSKGPAMWSPRAQCDRELYNELMCERMEGIPGLDIIEGEALEIIVEHNRIGGIRLKNGEIIGAKAVLLCAGTFLEGRIFTGRDNMEAGRWDEEPSQGLSAQMESLGFERMRLKTGTPPRIVKNTIDFSRLIPQEGDEDIHYFSIRTPKSAEVPLQLLCYQAYTNRKTHRLISDHFFEAPLFDGTISAIGPRYCPSIETKVYKFPEKDRHLLFVEPEGWDHPWMYLNGFSTSIPVTVQLEALRTIEGMEEAVIARQGYAIEYDAFPPHQVKYTLETRLVEGLYFAGQILGTSGYEEAAGLGMMAGVNAVLKLRGEKPFILDRSQAYIGVMIDDLIIRGAPEPYRMFTSRAEYRLLLRSDNAYERLSDSGRKLGLLDDSTYGEVRGRLDNLIELTALLNNTRVNYEGGNYSAKELLKRPEITIVSLIEMYPWISNGKYDDETKRLAEIRVKYEGYINRQMQDVERFRKMEGRMLPEDIDYDKMTALSYEGRLNLKRVKPGSLGAASRLFGVTPADIAVLAVCLRKNNVPHGTS